MKELKSDILDETILSEPHNQFLSAWKEALEGGTAPEVETYLDSVAEPEKTWLRHELKRVEKEFRLGQQNDTEHIAGEGPPNTNLVNAPPTATVDFEVSHPANLPPTQFAESSASASLGSAATVDSALTNLDSADLEFVLKDSGPVP